MLSAEMLTAQRCTLEVALALAAIILSSVRDTPSVAAVLRTPAVQRLWVEVVPSPLPPSLLLAAPFSWAPAPEYSGQNKVPGDDKQASPVLHTAASYALPWLHDCTQSRLDTRPSNLGAYAPGAWCPQCPQYPQCFGALGVLVPQSLGASATSLIDAWCPRASTPLCLGTLSAQTLLHRCLAPAPMSKFHPCTSCGGMLPPQNKHFLCVRCLGMQHASSALGDKTLCSICAVSHSLTLRRMLTKFTGVQPAQLSPLQRWEPRPPPSSTCLRACRRAYPAHRL
ncbi:UNVERIFIED_CONTAM: hypothetical protein FKN15_026116 [Acipenser sinensis]